MKAWLHRSGASAPAVTLTTSERAMAHPSIPLGTRGRAGRAAGGRPPLATAGMAAA